MQKYVETSVLRRNVESESLLAKIEEFNNFHFILDTESNNGLDLIEDLARNVFFDDQFVPALKIGKIVCKFNILDKRGLDGSRFALIDIFSRLIQSKGISKKEAEKEASKMFEILHDIVHVKARENSDGENEIAFGIREIQSFFGGFKAKNEKENIYKTIYLFYFLTYRLHFKDSKYINARKKMVSQVTTEFFGLNIPNIPDNLVKFFGLKSPKNSSIEYQQKQNFLREMKFFLMEYLNSNSKILLDTNNFFKIKPGQYVSDGKTYTYGSPKLAYDTLIGTEKDDNSKKRIVDNFVENYKFEECSDFSDTALANRILRDFILKYVIVDSRLV